MKKSIKISKKYSKAAQRVELDKAAYACWAIEDVDGDSTFFLELFEQDARNAGVDNFHHGFFDVPNPENQIARALALELAALIAAKGTL